MTGTYSGSYRLTDPSGTYPGTFTGTLAVTGTTTLGGVACYIVRQTFSNVTGPLGAVEPSTSFVNKRTDGTYAIGEQTGTGPVMTYSSPQLVLPQPLVVGQAWTAPEWILGESLTARCIIGAAQSVTVPFGAYQAVPVGATITGTYSGVTVSGTAMAWYAQGIGEIKESGTLTLTGPGGTASLTLTAQLASWSRGGPQLGPIGLLRVITRVLAARPA
jgi:hypothetical protein